MNISIIITHYNKGEFLVNSVESAFSQLEIGDEIIVIDDCSTDKKSLEHVYLVKDKFKNKIKIFFNGENTGASQAKNTGVNLANNEIIVLLDADDTLPDFSLHKIRDTFNNNKDIDILFGNYYRNEIKLNKCELVTCKELLNSNGGFNCKILAHKWLLLGTSPFKKDLFNKIGGFDKLNPRTDDRDFFIKAIMNKAKFHYLDFPIYNWNRHHDGNNSNIPHEDTISSYFRNILFYYKYSSRIRFILVLIKNILILFSIKRFNNGPEKN